jgi:hypothetical protein
MPIIRPGRFLSQAPMAKMPSHWWPRVDGLDAVGDQLARDQRKAHARWAIVRPSDTETTGHSCGHAAGRVDAGLGVLRLVAQVQVARAHLAAGVEHADVRARQLVVVLAQAQQEAAGWWRAPARRRLWALRKRRFGASAIQ